MKATALIAISLLLAGCATTQQSVPPELQYNAPTGAEGSLASLVGSQKEATLDNPTVFVTGIDGRRVMAERKGYSTPIPIWPGERKITVSFQRGSFNAQADLTLQASDGHQYQIQFDSDVRIMGANTYCDFWIIDTSTQKPVTDIRRGVVSSTYISTPILIPVR